MGRTPFRPLWGSEYPGTNVTDDPTSDGPGLAPQLIVPPAMTGAATSGNLTQIIKAIPTTGEVGWLSKWKTTNNSRRRSSWRANNLTPDYRSVGGEGAITLGGTGVPVFTNQNGVTTPFVRGTTESSAVGKSATQSTNLGLFRWKWDPLCGWWTRTVTFTFARLYWALTSATLDQVNPNDIDTALGAGGKALAFCVDGVTFGELNLRAITWDGSTLTITDTGISMTGSANTLFMPTVEVDTANGQARFYWFNRDTGVDHGLVETRAFVAGNTDVFGMQMVVEIQTGAAGALSLDGSEFFCEHSP